MAIQLIPTTDAPASTQTTTLEGTTFQLYLAFNTRVGAWYLSLADASGIDIYNGVKLIVGFPLLRKCKDPRRPAGDFVVLSSTADLSPPGLEDLLAGSGRCQLLYATSDWLAALNAGGVETLQAKLATGTQAQLSTYGLE